MGERLASSPARGLHNRAQKANTLMRGALKKPGENFSARLQQLTPGLSPQRELRARKVSKHGRVERFGHPTPRNSSQSKSPALQGELMNFRSAAKPAPVAKTQTVAPPSMVASASQQRIERMLDAALTQADAHKQALKYHAARHFWQRPGFMGKNHRLKLGLICLAVLATVLVLAWQKMPVLSVKLAGVRTHVDASMPSYKPEGYEVAAPAAIKSGAVVISYKSHTNGLGFEVAEQSSNMTSTSLAQTAVPRGAQVQTSHVDGNTVYIYGDSNDAAWVNNGVLYTIKDHCKLSSDQIIKIVHSLN